MSVIFILITCSLLLACGFLGAFLWASKAGQFEDDYTPSVRMLFDDEIAEKIITHPNVDTVEKSKKPTGKK